ncbi:kelch-like protein 31 [Dendronephthya gigantea]|uniref:kelch-like protein 31 n=1 Tax=Dendronephthya gigantea TaxID=151771 RepID=UPI00106C2F67|nr:kelch-like protein 31 [Dendronephthya gigantea]
MPSNESEKAMVLDPSVNGRRLRAQSGPACHPTRSGANAEKKSLERKRPRTVPEARQAEATTPELKGTENARSPLIIVTGGRLQNGESLRSAEAYIIDEKRWVPLPEMNIPRYLHSVVAIDNRVVVSGGDTGPGRTDTIEILDLDETPLRWIISDAKLRAPLCAHQTVAREGKLIVIGGNDENDDPGTRGNSNRIYEVDLAHPDSTRNLCFLPQPMAWHGAVMINDRIFIFGGGKGFTNPYNQISVYDPSTNTCHQSVQGLPHRVQGLAAVIWSNRVLLLGGVDAGGQELNTVISYNVTTGVTSHWFQCSSEEVVAQLSYIPSRVSNSNKNEV